MRGPRLQRTLLAWLLGPLLALLALDTAVSAWTSLRAADLAHDRTLHEIARELALHVRAGPQGPQLSLSPAAARILLVDADDRLFYRVTSASGRVVGGDPALAAPQDMPPGSPTRSWRDQLHGQPVRVAAAWLPMEEGAGGVVLVQVAETLNRRNQLALEILAHALVPQLLLIALAGAAVWVGVRRGLAPLQRVREDVALRSHRDLQPLPLHEVPAEVRPLVGDVNELMQRLGEALDLQQRFIADAAHELKTPVSGLKAQIELALRDDDPQRLHEALGRLREGVDRLSRMVRQLLALARNEPAAAASLRRAPLDLAALALEASMEWAPVALRRRIDLGFEGEEPAPGEGTNRIEGDADRVRELLNNLVDNAIRYSREGGRVTVSVHANGQGGVVLAVADDAPRIPPAERERVFERFHRVLGTAADGSGLGLSIVSEVAALHGARVTLADDPQGPGNRFSVWFPTLKEI